uniref:peptidylprolyl isomerase n=1 Tax=Prymnesium polylepis TaxID=72548 RepID=A0A6V4G211_9EUKA
MADAKGESHEHGHEHGHVEEAHGDGCERGCCGHDHDRAAIHDHGHDDGLLDLADKGDDISGEGGCFKSIQKEGKSAGGTPPPGSKVKVHYVGTLLDGSKFDSSRDRPGFFEFTIGQQQVIKGWDVGVATMHKGEVAVLTCRADYAYGASGHPPTIPPNATLKFEVELFGWKAERTKPVWQMSDGEKLSEAAASKAKGTDAFKAQEWAEAQELYADAAELTEGSFEEPAQADEAKTMRTSCLLNQAQCSLKLEEWHEAASTCAKVLEIDASNVKALFRRGTARTHLQEFEEAKADLREASRLDPKSRDIREAFALCKEKASSAKSSEKAMMAKMFG